MAAFTKVGSLYLRLAGCPVYCNSRMRRIAKLIPELVNATGPRAQSCQVSHSLGSGLFVVQQQLVRPNGCAG